MVSTGPAMNANAAEVIGISRQIPWLWRQFASARPDETSIPGFRGEEEQGGGCLHSLRAFAQICMALWAWGARSDERRLTGALQAAQAELAARARSPPPRPAAGELALLGRAQAAGAPYMMAPPPHPLSPSWHFLASLSLSKRTV